jgi:molybdopterin converting factor small subunit
MTVNVQLFAYFRKEIPGLDAEGRKKVSLPEKAKVSDLLEAIGILPSRFKLIILNGLHCKEDKALSEGDEVSIFPPIAGG